jgi:N-acetylneuraminate synthase
MKKVLIIAEAGINHNGNLELAKKLIDVAASAGVDYVKFQTFKAEKLVSKSARKADYQIENTGDKEESQFEMIKKLELDRGMHDVLIGYCKTKNIKFLSTAFDLDSIDMLEELNIDLFKIPSGEVTNLPYLQKIASKDKPIILSTGMCNLADIEGALNVLCKNGARRENITVLHCNTEYPTPMNDVNLNAMNTIASSFKVDVGYSDHTLGIEIPIAAVAKGAVCIEKHFTLNRNMEGPDHRASLEPDELRQMVKSIRNIEKALGNGIKRPSASEQKNIVIARKSIHIVRKLEKGDIITLENLEMKRPGSGISPMDLELVVGKKATRVLEEETLLTFKDFS